VHIEPVQDVDPVLKLAQRHVTQRRVDHPPDEAGRRVAGGQSVVGDFHPAPDQRFNGRRLDRMILGLDLGEHPIPGGSGLHVGAAGLRSFTRFPVIGSVPARTTAWKLPLGRRSMDPVAMPGT
jgi:hypothetical protein